MELVFTHIFLKDQEVYLHILMHKTEKWQVWGVCREFNRQSTDVFLGLFVCQARKLGYTEHISINCSNAAIVKNNLFFKYLQDNHDCTIAYSADCKESIADLNKTKLKYFLSTILKDDDLSGYFINQSLWNFKTAVNITKFQLVHSIGIDEFISRYDDLTKMYLDHAKQKSLLYFENYKKITEELFDRVITEIDYHDYTIGKNASLFYDLISEILSLPVVKNARFIDARTFFVQRKYEDAEKIFKIVIKDLDSSSLLFVEANICLAKIYQAKLDEKGARECIESISSVSAAKFNLNPMHYNLLRGNIALVKSDLKEALNYFNCAIIEANKLNNNNGLHIAYTGISNIYYFKQNYNYAKMYSEKAINISLYLSYKTKFHALHSCFLSEIMMKNIENAESLIKKMEMINLLTSDFFENAKLFINKACLFFEKKNYKKSINYYFKAAEIYAELQLNDVLIYIYQRLSIIYEKLDMLTKSLQYLYKAQALVDLFPRDDLYFYIYCQIGSIYLSKNNPEKALQVFKVLLKKIQNNTYYSGFAKYNLALAYEKIKSTRSSNNMKKMLKEALSIFQAINRKKPSEFVEEHIIIIKNKLSLL